MTDGSKCKICDVNSSKYSCPRCNIPYCSLSCYQSEKHIQCSELFYEKWVKEELKSCSSDPEAKVKMLEYLKRNYENETDESLDSDDEESSPDLATRLTNVNLNDEKAVWEKLIPEERSEFNKLVASGNIIKILPEWEPWWKTKKKKTLIQDCKENFTWKNLCPAFPSDIPELSRITKAKPSPCVVFMLLNVLESYILTVRWFRGAYKDLPVEAISTCITLSATLRNNEIFKSPLEALVAFEMDLSKCEWIKGEEYDKKVMLEDLVDIIKGSDNNDQHFCLKASISDINCVCTDAINVLKHSKTHHLKRFSGQPPKMSLLQQISRKMNYYLSWIKDYGLSMVEALDGLT